MNATSRKPAVLVVDERRYRELLELNLVRKGYRVVLASDGLGALNAAEAETPDLILLDLSLPGMDGYEVCRRIRKYSDVPIIMLTARTDERQKVQGLTLGADDYVTKPFGMEELLARIDAVRRRSERTGERVPAMFRSGALEIDFSQRRVTLNGIDVDLTPTEFRILAQLAQNQGRTLVQEELLRRVWGEGYETDAPLLHTAIRRLRQKLGEDAEAPRYVVTRRGIGYTMPAGG